MTFTALLKRSESWQRHCPITLARLHALQKTKRVERADGDQFEAHHTRFAQRQLFEHFVSGGRIGDVDDERHARLSCSEYHCSILPSR